MLNVFASGVQVLCLPVSTLPFLTSASTVLMADQRDNQEELPDTLVSVDSSDESDDAEWLETLQEAVDRLPALPTATTTTTTPTCDADQGSSAGASSSGGAGGGNVVEAASGAGQGHCAVVGVRRPPGGDGEPFNSDEDGTSRTVIESCAIGAMEFLIGSLQHLPPEHAARTELFLAFLELACLHLTFFSTF